MTKTSNPVRLALKDVLGYAGFSRRGDSWFRTTDEVVEVLNLQKSQWGNQYYLNYALWLLPLGETKFPKEERCHVRFRVDAIVSPGADLVRLLDLDADSSDAERRSKLVAVLTSELLPFAEACRTLSGLRSLYDAGKLSKAFVHIAAKRVLAAR